MKIFVLLATIILNAAAISAQSTCAASFKVNNGNGTCGSTGELRLNFPGGCPAILPSIDSVYINGVKSNVRFAAPDASKCGGGNRYISYCILSGNVPPANVWSIFFHDAQNVFNCMVATSTGPLAVKLTSFDAAVSGSFITCNWISAIEIDNDHYELERSFDGTSFSTIAFIFSKESTSMVSSAYSYLDKSSMLLEKKIVYYRLKDVDKDGKVSFSNIIAVRCADGFGKTMQVSPNPFRGSVALIVESAFSGRGEVRLQNLMGQVVSTTSTGIVKGTNSIRVEDLGTLSPGIYVVQVTVNGVLAGTRKIVKN